MGTYGGSITEPLPKRHRPAEISKMTLLDLPDPLLVKIFDALAEIASLDRSYLPWALLNNWTLMDFAVNSKRVTPNDPRRAFSQVCKKLDHIFREQYVRHLSVRPRTNRVLECLASSIVRYPAARDIRVLTSDDCRSETSSQLSLWADSATEQMRSGMSNVRRVEKARGIKADEVEKVTFCAPWQMSQRDASCFFRDVVPALRELHFDPSGSRRASGGRPRDSLMPTWIISAPIGLRKLTLDGIFRRLSDAEDQWISALQGLREVTLKDCWGFRQGTWRAFGHLPLQSLEIMGLSEKADMDAVEDGIACVSRLEYLTISRFGNTSASTQRLRLSLLERLPSSLLCLSIRLPFKEPLQAAFFRSLKALVHLTLGWTTGSLTTFFSLPPSLLNEVFLDNVLMKSGAAEAFTSPEFLSHFQSELSRVASGSSQVARLVALLPNLESLKIENTVLPEATIALAVKGAGSASFRKLKTVSMSASIGTIVGVLIAMASLPRIEILHISASGFQLEFLQILMAMGTLPKLRCRNTLHWSRIDLNCDAGNAMIESLMARPNLKMRISGCSVESLCNPSPRDD